MTTQTHRPAQASRTRTPRETTSIDHRQFAEWIEQQQRIEQLGKLFVVGCYKSGTTWLQRSLDAHPEMVVKGEGCAAWKLIPMMNQALVDYNTHQKQHNHAAITQLQNTDCLAQYRSVINAQLHNYLHAGEESPHDGIRVVGDKTPQHTVGIGILSGIFPEARFVHIVRDPRDAAVSAWFHGEPLRFGSSIEEHTRAFLAKNWPVNVRNATQSGDALGHERYCEIRYEDLLNDPVPTLQRVFMFCGVGDEERVASDVASRCSFSAFTNGRANGQEERGQFYRKGIAGDWKNHLDPNEVRGWCTGIADLMDRFGYAR